MLVQRYHPALRFGQHLTLAESGNALFSRQGHWDGGSALHCVAMALAMLGKLADPVYPPYHTSGNERVLWNHAWPHYLHGLTLHELASFVFELNLGVHPAIRSGVSSELIGFTTRELRAGHPVVVGWRQRHPVKWHAALVIGIEGRQVGRAFAPHTLLLLDPAEEAPTWASYNARLEPTAVPLSHYRSPTGTRAVKLMGAVSLRPRANAADCA